MDLELLKLVSEEQRDARRVIHEIFNQHVAQHHAVVVLAGAILGVVVPALHSQGSSLIDPWSLRAAAMAMGVSVLVGVLNYVVSKWLMVWMTFQIEQQFQRQNAAVGALANDDESGSDRCLVEAQQSHKRFSNRTNRILALAALGDLLFYGSFLLGMGLLVFGLRW